jgi:chemotaxis response regulator CheB
MDEEVEAGKEAFLKLVQEIDREVQVVIPSRATSDHYLISLTKGKAREFISVSEGDLIDLVEMPDIRKEVTEKVREAYQKISS